MQSMRLSFVAVNDLIGIQSVWCRSGSQHRSQLAEMVILVGVSGIVERDERPRAAMAVLIVTQLIAVQGLLCGVPTQILHSAGGQARCSPRGGDAQDQHIGFSLSFGQGAAVDHADLLHEQPEKSAVAVSIVSSARVSVPLGGAEGIDISVALLVQAEVGQDANLISACTWSPARGLPVSRPLLSSFRLQVRDAALLLVMVYQIRGSPAECRL